MKIEQDVMVLMSGLYCLISLLPIIPQSIMTFLNDLFEISHHLAKMTYHSSNIKECELIHLQYGYYMLFGRLYGMYPCNFTEFLRNEYIVKQDNTPIFNHTIRPLFETFKIHPNLVTSTKSLETNNSRFKKMEPHDVVVECAKYTIEVDRPPPTSSLEYQVYRSPLKPLEYTHLSPELPPLPEPPLYMSAKSVESKIESLLRPSSVVLATPPPTTTVPNTPTPTPIPIPNYGMKQTEQSSPPQLIEAAIEATPETTPMKPDGINQPFRPFPKQNSQTARRIFGVNQSSPSSPLRKDPQQSQFHYATNESENLDITGNHKLMRMMSDRQHHQITEPMMISREDQEVNEINSHNTSNDENGAQEMMDYDETPSTDNDDDVVEDADTTPPLCDPRFYNGGEYVRRVKRLRQYSQCIYSAGTSPASNTSYMIRARSVSRVKRSNSWPNLQESDVVINPTKSKELNGSHQQKTASSSPSDEAISADSHFKKKDQNGNADKVKLQQQQNLFKEIRNDLKSKPLEVVQKASKGTSTVECWPGMSAYDNLFYDAFLSDDLKRKQSNGLTVTTTTTTITEYSHQAYSTVHKPTTSELLDQHIQVALKMKMKPQDYKDHIELLSIQLQFEKYRREIHAERNRRLLGKSRQIRGLEQSNETMSDQVARLSTEITNLNKKAAETRNHYEMQLQKCQNDIKILSKKCNEEMEKNRQLQREKDSLQRKFEEEQQTKCQLSKLNDEMTAKIFDLKSLLEAAQEEAQRGKEYRQQLVKLQSEMIIFNDARVKCKQRMEELNSLKARDEEAEGMYERYSYEIAEIQKKLEMKTSQNDSYRSKICDLEQQLSKKESSIREHKILNVSMIRTYDEKFKVIYKIEIFIKQVVNFIFIEGIGRQICNTKVNHC